VYPAEANPETYYGASPWDVPNRFSLTLNYELPGLSGGQGFVGHITRGWGISGTSIFQSGYPQMIWNTASFQPVCASNVSCPSSGNPAISYTATSGDYNADGDTSGAAGVGLDYPDVSSYHQGTSKSAFLSGVFSTGQFAQPAFGSQGNEKPNQFRGPNFYETDANFYKDTHLTERISLQLRFEFFNIFNRVNFANLDNDLSHGTFGTATQQQLPRNWQVAARIAF